MAGILWAGGRPFNIMTDIPDLAGKIILITGGNVGIGKATCSAIALHNPEHIYLACRNQKKAEAAIADIHKTSPGVAISSVSLDLSTLSSVQTCAKNIAAAIPKVDVIFCNAGYLSPQPGQTKDGYEIQFGINHMGHALFLKHLLPNMVKTAKTPGSDVRLVVVSSLGHQAIPKGGIRYEDIKSPQADLNMWWTYGESKLANLQYAKALAKRYPSITVASVHPGFVNSNLPEELGGVSYMYRFGIGFAALIGVFKTPAVGCLNQLWAAFGPKDEITSGGYYEPIAMPNRESKYAKDDALIEKLYKYTEAELEPYKV